MLMATEGSAPAFNLPMGSQHAQLNFADRSARPVMMPKFIKELFPNLEKPDFSNPFENKAEAPAKEMEADTTEKAELQPVAATKEKEEEEEGWTIDKVAALGLAGVLSIAVAETVFWVLSFPASELLYFASTGEYIDLLSQEGQIKFLAFTAGWGAIGGAIAQYRTVLTAAALTPWMDENVVKPYVQPFLDNMNKDKA